MRIFKKNSMFNILALGLILFGGCEKDDLKTNTLSVDPTKIEFQKEGGSASMTIKTDADSWNISQTSSAWLVLSSTSGKEKTAVITLKVDSQTYVQRVDTLKITAGNAKPVLVVVSQLPSDKPMPVDTVYTLTADIKSISLKQKQDSAVISISTNVAQWNITSSADWLKFSQTTGTSGDTKVTVTGIENAGIEARTAEITISSEKVPNVLISVTQKGTYYPSYNTSAIAPDGTGMTSSAVELAAKIKLGFNIGNTLEATGGETAWGNPKITKAFVDFAKQSGFNAIRLPCSWNQNMANAATAQLKTDWLNRVKEVIQYCVDNDMYVLLNIHWDGGWLENNCTVAKQDENNAKQKAFWEQIATHMRDFDEHLLFASANEPNVTDATQMAVLKSYHQTFIDAVRATGGKNSNRVLVVQGPSTDIEKTNSLMNALPTDVIPNRLMVEIHYYTPWNFCGMEKDESWGNMFYYWGKDNHSKTDLAHNPTWGEEATVDANFKLMKAKFVDKGIPVILGEYGASVRNTLKGDALALHLASRAFYYKYVTKQAKANGLLPFVWDTGGILNRKLNTVSDTLVLNALIQGATE